MSGLLVLAAFLIVLGIFQLLLATPVVVWAGRPFFVRGWRSIMRRSLNMFTLIAIGTGAAPGRRLPLRTTHGTHGVPLIHTSHLL